MLGVDDWPWRKGHRYGTILVDLERNEVVDMLPDRKADTLSAWLKEHPGVEIIARDRASAYAEEHETALRTQSRWLTVGICSVVSALRSATPLSAITALRDKLPRR